MDRSMYVLISLSVDRFTEMIWNPEANFFFVYKMLQWKYNDLRNMMKGEIHYQLIWLSGVP